MQRYDNYPSAASGITRRQLLERTAGFTFVLALGPVALGSRASSDAVAPKELSVWVRIDRAGSITIYNPVAEMGQGASTALPLILAEELDADWADVVVEYAPIEAEIYGHDALFGRMLMLTVGSYSVRAYFDRLRMAGAQVRQVLLENAAAKLDVPVSELTTDKSTVYHSGSDRKLKYAEIIEFATIPASLPPIATTQLKPINDFQLIGKAIPRIDITPKVDGSAVYSIDVEVPGMQYGMIQRAPVNGASPLSSNSKEILALPGITKVITLDYGVGIVGRNIWAVMKARKALKVVWSTGAEAELFSTTSAFAAYAKVASSKNEPNAVVTSSGDVAVAGKSATKTYQADYFVNFVYHAQIEPLNAVASVSKDGKKAELWVGSQFPSGLRTEVAKLLNTDSTNVTIHPCYLGGGFGRRSWHDFGLESVQLSQGVGTPVKLLWSREDDIRNGAYRPISLQRMAASLDAEGEIVSWTQRTVGDDFFLTASGSSIPFYDIANQQITFHQAATGIRSKHWRSVAYGPNKYAIESFVDEIASGQGVDPYTLRRKLLAKSPRALSVLDAAVRMSEWGKKSQPGKALGLAFAEGVGSLTAGVVEISVDESNGKIAVHRVWAAIDSGIVVQPENALQQHKGAILQGISSVLLESITLDKGVVQQSNFDDYPLLKMADSPAITIKLISSDAAPTGIGEAALPFTAAAVGNAFFSLTGKRLRTLPFSTTAVKAILKDAV